MEETSTSRTGFVDTTVVLNEDNKRLEERDESTMTPTSSVASLSPHTPTYPSYATSNTGEEAASSPQHNPQVQEPPPLELNNESTQFTMEAPLLKPIPSKKQQAFHPMYNTSLFLEYLSHTWWFQRNQKEGVMYSSTWLGFWAMLHITCANYVLMPMRDAVALAVGVQHMPTLTLASTVLAFVSSVPIGWLFEAPDPARRKILKKLGLTRGETQGTSLALFYRTFALSVLSYAVGFKSIRLFQNSSWVLLAHVGQFLYIAFFLVVHLMKLHSLSLMWGVTMETMEYEEVARKEHGSKSRMKRLAFIGFGGTLGGILGSVIASSLAHVLKMSGLLVVAAILLEISAELAIEMGRIMQRHWEEQQLFRSCENLASLDASMKRVSSVGSMKRIASGNSLHRQAKSASTSSLNKLGKEEIEEEEPVNDNTFMQRLLRGISTILRSRLLMAIFTYNALYASTTVLLSFQRAALVVSRNANSSTESDTAFLANINIASSVSVFVLQFTGLGAYVAHKCGSRGTLALMPLIRLLGVMCLAWWHVTSGGKAPNLILFLLLDECCRVMNLAVAKPVRESLWRGLSNEARYEAKPIVDTLANRWGSGSAAFLVSLMDKALGWFGIVANGDGSRDLFGFPPVLFLCMIISAWWAMVSADLGQIRKRIDLELKKHQ